MEGSCVRALETVALDSSGSFVTLRDRMAWLLSVTSRPWIFKRFRFSSNRISHVMCFNWGNPKALSCDLNNATQERNSKGREKSI